MPGHKDFQLAKSNIDFNHTAASLSLAASWSNTNIQNLRTDPSPVFEPTDSFTYQGSKQTSNDYCCLDLTLSPQ